jgi:NADH:ubiquinone oxidoreductase subunit 2 (subunit N)
MYMREPDAAAARPALTPAAGLALAVTAWLTVHLGVLPGPVLALAQRAVAPLVP